MKPFLNSVAIAAVLAITVPALAQAQSPGPRSARPHASAGHRHAGHVAGTHRRGHVRTASSTAGVRAGASPTDNVANQLNGQELQRLEASAAPAGMAAPPMGPPGSQLGPRASGGGGAFPAGAGGPISTAPGTAAEGPRASGGGGIAAPTGPMPMPPPPPVSSPVR